MSDGSVASALRSQARLVVIEAPAGCGKTFQACSYACDVAPNAGHGRVLVLTHTHAAKNEFASRTRARSSHIEARTIDSLIAQIGTVYHEALDLPRDVMTWTRCQRDGYDELAKRVAALLEGCRFVSRSLARRYPIVVCDEHQDASPQQHSIVLSLLRAGAKLRVFGDPMQDVFSNTSRTATKADDQQWSILKASADMFDKLTDGHRWKDSNPALGRWIFDARARLESGHPVEISDDLPHGVSILWADNASPRYGGFQLTREDASPIYRALRCPERLLVLSAKSATVDAVRAAFGRQLPIWEGHVREDLGTLVAALNAGRGDAVQLGTALLQFLKSVAKGLSPSEFGNTFIAELKAGCVSNRTGRPRKVQDLARIIWERPDHVGICTTLERLLELVKEDSSFRGVRVDHPSELRDAVELGKYDDPMVGLGEILNRRSYCHPQPPARSISTVHKAKGLQAEHVVIIPCDGKHFKNTWRDRCTLYVALSRATKSITLVVARSGENPLFTVRARAARSGS